MESIEQYVYLKSIFATVRCHKDSILYKKPISRSLFTGSISFLSYKIILLCNPSIYSLDQIEINQVRV